MNLEAVNSAQPVGARSDERWLERWLPLLREHTARRCVLELGCGKGRDTAVLHAAGLDVVALDRSSEQLTEARRAVPGARFIESDLRAALPIESSEVGAIVASLCLHYFDWQTTRQIVARWQRCLAPGVAAPGGAAPGGALICRVNSTGDVHHGATGHPELEPGFFRVGDETKRFFTRADVNTLFADGWQIDALEEHTIDRYSAPKVVWEIVARADGSGEPAPHR